MKRTHPEVTCVGADEFLDTLLHLPRSFVGERQG